MASIYNTTMEKIFQGSLKIFTKDVITKFNTSTHSEFIQYTKLISNSVNSQESILKFYYFDKFFPILQKYSLIQIVDKELDQTFSTQLDQILISSLKNNKSIYNFLMLYGNYRKQLIDDLFTQYASTENEDLFLKLSKVFLVNSYSKQNWEEIFANKINLNKVGYKDSSLNFKLLKHINCKYKNIIDLPEYFVSPNGNDSTYTKTPNKIKIFLESLDINFEVEYQRDGYIYDFFLPDLNIILEFDGPLHFYPLQTQLVEKFKFRYKNITETFNSKLILIPYFEYSRCDTDMYLHSYLKRAIFKESNLVEGSMFFENYDMFKPSTKPMLI